MNYEFYVITYTPDLLEKGNTAHDFMWEGYDWTNDKPIMLIGHSNIGKSCSSCKTAVFQKGEIVICDDSGREVCYPGRKPSKWDVEYEVFNNLDDAVKRAQELI